MNENRSAFVVSDRTGITSESMGEALLNQFNHIQFKRSVHPFIDTTEKAHEMVEIINEAAHSGQVRPIVFSSIVNEEIRQIIKTSKGLHLDFFDAFVGILEQELGTSASHLVGNIHGIQDTDRYDARMEAVNFSLNHDDGITDKELQKADIILVGVSRSGKTPTCLYLALQYGIRAANYPLTPDDLCSTDLPRMLKPFRKKLFGLTIDSDRLHHIRTERRPDSTYASLSNCRSEIRDAEEMFRQYNIPYMSTTHKSVEELAANILQKTGISRRF